MFNFLLGCVILAVCFYVGMLILSLVFTAFISVLSIVFSFIGWVFRGLK